MAVSESKCVAMEKQGHSGEQGHKAMGEGRGLIESCKKNEHREKSEESKNLYH